jgi:hypothetical protein
VNRLPQVCIRAGLRDGHAYPDWLLRLHLRWGAEHNAGDYHDKASANAIWFQD